MTRRALLSAFFSIITCLLHAQPVRSGHLLFPGKPIMVALHQSDVFMVTSKGIFKVDSTGTLLSADTAYFVTAADFDGANCFYLTGVIDTNGISAPYVRKMTSGLQESFFRLLSTSGPYLPSPGSIEFNGQDRVYIGGSAFDSSSTPNNAQYFAGLDTSGNIAWSFVYGIGADEQAFKLMKCDPYGNAVMGSDIGLTGPSAGEMHFRKFDSTGNFIYENLFDPVYAKDLLNDFDFGTSGQTYLTGPFNLTGIIGNTISALVVFDSSGLFNGFSTFDGYGFDEKQRISADWTGNLYGIVSGTDHSGPGDSHFDIMKFDGAGNIIWSERNRDGSIAYQKAESFLLGANGRIFIVGEHRDDTLSNRSGLIVAYDTTGAFEYEIVEPFPGNDVIYTGFMPYSDSIYHAYGYHIDNTGDTMTVLVKYENPTVSIEDPKSANTAFIVPNPADDHFYLRSTDRIMRVSMYDFSGRLVKSMTDFDNGIFAIEDLPGGYYNITIETDKGWSRYKLVVE